MDLGEVVSVALRDLWPGEAAHFTPWLAENLDVLGEKLGMDLALEGTEATAGEFSADILARDENSNKLVVIENQYGGTDHKHLGQLLTYASVLGAGAVVWIAESIRSEHKSALDFLNQNLKESLSFYAVEASAIRIDNSRPAFLLAVVCKPNEIQPGPTPPVQPSEIRERYRAYFQGLIDELRLKHKFTNAKIAQAQNWYTFRSDNSKVYRYSSSFAQGSRVRVELYIDCGDEARNKQIFDCLLQQQLEIENEIGCPLNWERLDNRRACRVAIYRDGDIEADSETLTEIRNWAIEYLLKFRSVFPTRMQHCEVASTTPL